jgi:O-methyltransferase domain
LTEPEIDPVSWVTSLVYGYRSTGLIGTAARLNIADEMGGQALEAGEIADRVHVPPNHLVLLLRALVAVGLVTQTADGRYYLTEFGALLRSDHPLSVRMLAAHALQVIAPAYERLVDALRTDVSRPAVVGDQSHRQSGPVLLASDDDPGELTSFPGLAAAIGAAVKLPPTTRSLVDVGGGSGSVLAELLAIHPGVSGVLFDLPAVVAQLDSEVAQPRRRWRAVAGSFFDHVPAGADVYTLVRILCNWPDEAAVTILQRCREAMAAGGTLYIVEQLLQDRPTVGSLVELGNLDLFSTRSGRLRTRASIEELLERAELDLVGVDALPMGEQHHWAILVARTKGVGR